MFRFALADVVILNRGGHSIFLQTFTLRSERFRSEFEGCFDIWNPTNFQGREKTNNIVGRHRGYLVMLGVKIHSYNIAFFRFFFSNNCTRRRRKFRKKFRYEEATKVCIQSVTN